MTTKAYYLSPDNELECDLNEKGVTAAFESGKGLLWVDIEGNSEEDGRLLGQTFKFHHLAVEDCLSTDIHPPKVDNFGSYIFVIVHGINYAAESDIVDTTELSLFIGPHFVVTQHAFPFYSVEAIKRMTEEDGRPLKRGADFLAYSVMDALIDNVLPTIDKLGEFTDDIEEEAIHNPQRTTIEAILKLKRSTMRLHRVMAPQREVLNRLSRREFLIVTEEAQIFFRDVYDHLVRIEDLNQNIRDRADNALSTYMSSIANRQNETMRVLSIVAAIFMPLTLLAGIYGMNFDYMPELRWHWGYFAVLGVMFTAIISITWWLWAKNLISWGRKKAIRIRPPMVEPHKLVGHIAGRLKNIPRL
ncbi:magnesium/cobalt transporter CorA [Chloroflexota bacterium]